MQRFKLTLEYDGTDFFGWQLQAKAQERTVQGVLREAFSKLPGTFSNLKAAGRTDAGVHALAMVAHVDIDTTIPVDKLLRAINAHLPEDVKVISLEPASSDFDAQYDCLYRRYIYKMRLLRNDLRGVVLDRKYVLGLYQALNVSAMQEGAKYFEGKHDFAALATQEVRETTRTVYLCKLEANDNNLNLHIAADGFLRNMVRAVAGTLLEVGEGKIHPGEIQEIIASKDRSRAGQNAPAHGLYFVEAGYNPWK
jgi:tRNA pseudouridine38-40 synthase